jgi:general secretion pathway protein I
VRKQSCNSCTGAQRRAALFLHCREHRRVRPACKCLTCNDRPRRLVRERTLLYTAARVMRRHAGFTLIEVLIAMALLGSALVAIAQLFADATRSGVSARRASYAIVLADAKVEELKLGSVVVGSTDALRTNTPGFVDHVDAQGQVVGRGATPPGSALYTRRWSVQPALGAPEVFVIQVSVVASHLVPGPAPETRLPEEARLLAVRGP